MKVDVTGDCASLVMRVEGVSPMTINVVDINSTHIWEKCLLIVAKRNDQTITWGMQFMALDVTSRFKEWLDALCLATAPKSPHDKEETPVAVEEQPEELEQPLIDFSTTDEFDYEGVVKQLQAIVARIIPECTERGLEVSNDAIHEIEETIIASWREQGFLKNMPYNIEAELLQVLRSLLRLKRKAQETRGVSQGGFQLTPTMEALMELQLGDDMQPKPSFTKYTALEIQELRGKAISMQKTPMMDYVAGLTCHKSSTTVAIPKAAQGRKAPNGLESSCWASPQATRTPVREVSGNALPETVKSQEPKPKQGLDASYWAK
ncbi:hypothetical protein CDD82_7885 [Ophiocordyceps australis]|uniref:Uncharacterized protein n=1 Tax=Ophiocordyceps australis TaxID=1399860 RepID=A0A2C5Y1J7_9HYPO|nr:hypothetical protein CDD82_7885 [Ophiocordyceps australis]